MIRTAPIAFVLLTCMSAPAPGQQWATKMFETTSHDFGTVPRAAKSEYTFEFTNRYVDDVHISSVSASCGCTTPIVLTETVKPLEKGRILARFNTGSFLGKRSATLTVTIDRPQFAQVQLHIKGHVRTDVVLDPPSVDFGKIEPGSVRQKRVRLSYAGRNDWAIRELKSSHSAVEVTATEVSRGGGRVSYDLLVKLNEGAASGVIHDAITLSTNDRQLQNVQMLVQGEVVPSLSVSPGAMFLGALSPGEQVTRKLVVRGKSPFRIMSIESKHGTFAFQPSEEPRALHLVPFTYTAGTTAGTESYPIMIQTDLNGGSSASCKATVKVVAR